MWKVWRVILAVIAAAATGADPQASDNLIAVFKSARLDNDIRGGEHALKELLGFRNPKIDSLFVSQLFDPRFANQAKWCLIRRGKSAFPAGWVQIRTDSKRANVVYEVWARCGPGGIREITKGLFDSRTAVQRSTVSFIALVGLSPGSQWADAKAVRKRLAAFFADPSPTVRRDAVDATFKLPYPHRDVSAARVLRLQNDHDARVRSAVTRWLTYIEANGASSAACTKAAIRASKDPSLEVRRASLFALDTPFASAPDVIARAAALARLARDPLVDREGYGIGALGRWFHPDGMPGAARGGPPDAHVIRRVRQAVRAEGIEATAFRRIKEPGARRNALACLTYMNPDRAFPVLISGIRSADHSEVFTCAQLLALTTKPGVRELLEGARPKLGRDTDRLIAEYVRRVMAKAEAKPQP